MSSQSQLSMGWTVYYLIFFFFFKMIFTKHGRMVLLHPKGFTI